MNEVIKRTAEGAGNQPPDVWLTWVIIICVFSIIGLVVWKIAIPNSQAAREASGKFADAINTMASVMTRHVEKTNAIDDRTEKMEHKLDGLVNHGRAATKAIQKVAKTSGVDVEFELGQMLGALPPATPGE